VQLDPIKPALKVPGTKHLTLEYGKLLSNFGFKFNLRRYTEGDSLRKFYVSLRKQLPGSEMAEAWPHRYCSPRHTRRMLFELSVESGIECIKTNPV